MSDIGDFEFSYLNVVRYSAESNAGTHLLICRCLIACMLFLFTKDKQTLDTTGPMSMTNPDKSGSSTMTPLSLNLPGKNLKEIPTGA